MTEKEMLSLMGKPVVVYKTLERDKREDGRFWLTVDLDEPLPGWIVGFRWLLNGKVIPGTPSDWLDPDGYSPAYLRETSPRTPCVMVAFWPTKKPVYVAMESFRLAGLFEHPMHHPGRKKT